MAPVFPMQLSLKGIGIPTFPKELMHHTTTLELTGWSRIVPLLDPLVAHAVSSLDMDLPLKHDLHIQFDLTNRSFPNLVQLTVRVDDLLDDLSLVMNRLRCTVEPFL